MAADSKVTVGDESYHARKIHRIDGMIVGAAGHARAIGRLVRWLERGMTGRKPKIEKKDSLDAIILTSEGLYRVDCNLDVDEVKDAFLAVGTGSFAALAALHCGLSPEGAIEIACRIDGDSDLPVDVLFLNA